MHLRDMFAREGRTFSFEFFPPRSDKAARELIDSMCEFSKLRPTFVSVTYGAGGSTRDRTHNLVVALRQIEAIDPMPHLTCVGHDEDDVSLILRRYARNGLSNIMALRGDAPQDGSSSASSFKQAADLVRFIQRFNDSNEHPDRRGFGVAIAAFPEGHPQTPNRMLEMDYLKAKVDAGADAIITQMFFDNHDFYDFRERCELAGITIPILAGIMPVTSFKGMRKMAELAAGARYPASLLRAINRTQGREEAVRRVGVHWATEQSRDLLDHDVAGIHFYTLNRSTATREIYATLGVSDSLALGSHGA